MSKMYFLKIAEMVAKLLRLNVSMHRHENSIDKVFKGLR